MKIYFCSKSEIPNFDIHVLTEKEISKFKISMDNFLGVKIIESLQYLNHKILDLILRKPSFLFYKVIKSLNHLIDTLFVQSSNTM